MQEDKDILDTEDPFSEEIANEGEFSDIEGDYDDSLSDDSFGLDNNGNAPIDRHGDLLKNLTDFDPYIQNTFYAWLGYSWDETTQKWAKDANKRAIMSYDGANNAISILRTYARNNNIITNISSQDYSYIVEDLIEVTYLNYGTRDDFGVKDDGDLLIVCNQILHCCQLVLMGAGDGKYNDLLTSTTHRNESVTVNPQGGMQGRGAPGPQSSFQKIKDALLGQQ